jgi:hypothetical protein
MEKRGRDSGYEPPDQPVERQQVGGQDSIRHRPSKEDANVHDLARGNPVGDDEAKEDNPKRCEPD